MFTNRDIARSFVLDFGRLEDIMKMLESDAPKRFTQSFPPADIYRLDNDWIIRLAVAGFKANEISVAVEDEQLIIKSVKSEIEVKLPEGTQVIHNGIAKRMFERRWQLSEGMEVVDVRMEDGILTVGITQHIPENKKPKTYAINGKVKNVDSASFFDRVAGLLK